MSRGFEGARRPARQRPRRRDPRRRPSAPRRSCSGRASAATTTRWSWPRRSPAGVEAPLVHRRRRPERPCRAARAIAERERADGAHPPRRGAGRLLERESSEIDAAPPRLRPRGGRAVRRDRRAEGRRHHRRRTGIALPSTPAAAPRLATAGTGDVLVRDDRGAPGAGLEPFTAAARASTPHQRAGRIAAERVGAAEVAWSQRTSSRALPSALLHELGRACAPPRSSTSAPSSATACGSPPDSRARPRLCAVVKADGYGHGAVECCPRRARGRAPLARASPPPPRRESSAPRSGRPSSCRGRSRRTELDMALAARTSRCGGPITSTLAAARGAERRERPARPRQVRQRHGPARRARPRAVLRVVDEVAGDDRLELAGFWTHFATADEPRFAVLRRAAGALRGARRASASGAPRRAAPRGEQRRDAARARFAFRHGALRGRRSTASTRSAGSGRARARAGARLLSYVADVKRFRRAPAPVTAGAGGLRRDTRRGAADRLRRRRPAGADEQRRRPRRRRAPPAGRDRLDGQHHGRPRPRRRRSRRERRGC